MRSSRRIPFAAATAAVATAALAGCGDAGALDATDPAPSSPASPSPSATASDPAPSAAEYVVPEQVEGEIARAEHAIVDGVPTTSSIALAAIEPGQTITVDGQCVGDGSTGYTLTQADVGGTGDTILEGTIVCDEESAQPFTYDPAYAGPAQLTIAPGEGVDEAWAIARVADPS